MDFLREVSFVPAAQSRRILHHRRVLGPPAT